MMMLSLPIQCRTFNLKTISQFIPNEIFKLQGPYLWKLDICGTYHNPVILKPKLKCTDSFPVTFGGTNENNKIDLGCYVGKVDLLRSYQCVINQTVLETLQDFQPPITNR